MNAELDDWKRGDETLLYSALHVDPRLPPQRICTQLVDINDADEKFRITFSCRLRAAVHESMKL